MDTMHPFSSKHFWHTFFGGGGGGGGGLFSNTVISVKSLIAIILVIPEFKFVVQDCGEWRFWGGGGDVGAQNSVFSAALLKQQSFAAKDFMAHYF